MNYITSAELARRCDVTRSAVAIAIREHRISPDKVRRAGGRVLVEEAHGFSVLGHHKKTKPAAVQAPIPDDDGLADLLAWGSAPIMATDPGAADDGDELTGAAEVADLEQQIELWNDLVIQKDDLLAWWRGSYNEFREWITTEAVTKAMEKIKETPSTRLAVCEAIAIVQAQLRARLDDVNYQSGLNCYPSKKPPGPNFPAA